MRLLGDGAEWAQSPHRGQLGPPGHPVSRDHSPFGLSQTLFSRGGWSLRHRVLPPGLQVAASAELLSAHLQPSRSSETIRGVCFGSGPRGAAGPAR